MTSDIKLAVVSRSKILSKEKKSLVEYLAVASVSETIS